MEDVTTNPDRACKHQHFVANVTVGRIGEGDPGSGGMPTAYTAEVTVNCAPAPDGCGEQFRFNGLQAGLSYAHPMCNVDETLLIAPLRPASADPDFGLGIPGYAIQQVVNP